MKTLIFADVHLKVSPDGSKDLEDFVGFLSAIDPNEVDRVIILGDLFDFWFEYRHVIFSGYFEVLRVLAALKDRGVSLHLVCGNHDFWAGRFLEEQLGFSVHPDRLEQDMGGKRVLFVHGDGINPSDRGYRVFKWIARKPLVISTFRLLHPDWAMKLAQIVSHSSRTLLAPDDPADSDEVKAMRAFAQGVLERGEADVIFCGHTHYPVEETFERDGGAGRYMNTGAWLRHRTYIEWDGEEFTRKYYEAEEATGD